MLKNIVILNDHGYISGGAAQVAITSISGLVDRGYRVIYIFGRGPFSSREESEQFQFIDLNNHDLLSNPSKINAAIAGLWNFKSSRKVAELLKTLNPSNTIVHLHNWTKSLTSSVIREINRYGFKIVCSLHDYFTVCPNGGLFNYNTKSPCMLEPLKLKCLLTNCDSRSYKHKTWRVLRHVIQNNFAGMPLNIKNFITYNDFKKNILMKYLPDNATFFEVTNFIEAEYSEPSNPAKSNSFTFVGRLSPEKGADLFANAAFLEKVDANFVGHGIVENDLKNIYPGANFWGWRNRQEVTEVVRNSRAIVFPSRWYETQGLIIKEAAALGVPSIVSDGCAGVESIVDGETGLLFRSGDTFDLASKINLLKENPDYAVKLGLNAFHNYWNNPATLERHANELLLCYNSILDMDNSLPLCN
jgi:glycosyltransferase involved in cell wall biosynthesis